jgi:TrmH family RNA methyltransferase
MKNFGFENLFLIKPCELGDECYKRSKHAKDIILNAKTYDSLGDVAKEFDLMVGTSGVKNINDKRHKRNPITPRQFVEHAKKLEPDTRVGLLFGREDYGLYTEELSLCDILITIPANEVYPILNLSHAVAVVLYELGSAELTFNVEGHHETSEFEKEKLYEHFNEFLDHVDYPEQKREHTRVLFRRLMGRAAPSKWEFHTMMGLFSRAIYHLEGRGGAKKDRER